MNNNQQEIEINNHQYKIIGYGTKDYSIQNAIVLSQYKNEYLIIDYELKKLYCIDEFEKRYLFEFIPPTVSNGMINGKIKKIKKINTFEFKNSDSNFIKKWI